MTLPSDYLHLHYNIKVPGPVRLETVPKVHESNLKSSQEFQQRIPKPRPQEKPKPRPPRPITRLSCDEIQVIDQPKPFYSAGEKFVKMFRCKNNGIDPWPEKLHIRWISACSNERMECARDYKPEISLTNHEIKPGSHFDLKIHLEAPEKRGIFFEVWRLIDPQTSMSFGKMIRVQIAVI